MLTVIHAFVLAGLLLVPTVGRAGAVQVLPDTSALHFLGFRAGARLDELSIRLRDLGGSQLRCRRSRIDPRVAECRGLLSDRDLAGPMDVWISAIDSVAGVITLSALVEPEQLDRWRQALQESYGLVGKRVQGSQSMLQWVRRGRMIRLTWRLEARGKVASVSLVDGRVLDDWGRARARPVQSRPSDSVPALSSRAGSDSSPPSHPACSPERPGPTPSTCGAAPAPESGSGRRRPPGLGR
jgi:hypothetical protein